MQHTVHTATGEASIDEPLDVPGQSVDTRRQLTQLQSVIRLASLATSVLVIALPIYSSNFNASGLEKGLLFAIPAFMTAIARPIIGKGIDRFGRKPFLVLGTGIMAISMLLFLLAREFNTSVLGIPIQLGSAWAVTMLFVARSIQGFAIGTMLLSSYAITADLARQAGRGSSFGYTEEAQYRGGLYGGLLAIPVLIFFGFDPKGELRINESVWSIIFCFYAVGAIIAFVFAIRRIPDTRHLAIIEAEEKEEQPQRINPQLYVLMAIVMLTTASSYGLAPFILTYIQDHLTQNLIFIAMAYVPAALIWAYLPSKLGAVADRVGRKPPMITGLLMSGLFSLTIPFLSMVFPNNTTAIIALATFATLEAMCYAAAVPAEQALVADMIGSRQRGIGFGLYTLAQSMGMVFGPLLMGVLYDWDRSGPFLANAVILMLGSFLVLTFLRDPRAKKPAL